MVTLVLQIKPVGSKNSCGLAVVVLEQPTEPFPALNRAVTLAALAGRTKEQDIAFSLMISLVMIMGSILREGVPQGFFPKENELRQTLLLDGSHPAFRVG